MKAAPMTDEEAFAIIPWFVNGTLDASQAAELEARAKASPAFAKEIALQRRLAVSVAAQPVAAARPNEAWRHLEARLSAAPGSAENVGSSAPSGARPVGARVTPELPSEAPSTERARRLPPPRGVRRRLGAALQRVRGLISPPVALSGAAAFAVLVCVAVWPQLSGSPYETLTSSDDPSVSAGFVELRVRPIPDTDLASVRRRLREAGAADIGEPSETGLIRAKVPAGQAEAIGAALLADPNFLVVAVD